MWLDLVRDELRALDPRDWIDPNSRQEQGEEEIGVISDKLKGVYTLMVRLAKALDCVIYETKYADSSERASMKMKIAELTIKGAVVKEIFWACVAEEFNLWNEMSEVGIREGFMIVRVKPRSRFLDFLLPPDERR